MPRKNGFVRENVASLAEPPSIKRRDMQVWTAEQMRKFLDIANGERLYIAFYLALNTVMRRGEILGLRWKDLDFERNAPQSTKSYPMTVHNSNQRKPMVPIAQ